MATSKNPHLIGGLPHVWLQCGDAIERLRRMPDQSVHMIVTSPPYYGLRLYDDVTWSGGDPKCQHKIGGRIPQTKSPKGITGGVRPGQTAVQCILCGATRSQGQIGLEQTIDEYVARLVAVFHEARRVLRDDGTLWLNIGDSYSGSWGNYVAPGSTSAKAMDKRRKDRYGTFRPPTAGTVAEGLKPKDICLVPWRLGLALQADGWYLRLPIIWEKDNPMPASVMDRPTMSYEYILLLSKQRRYYCDMMAIGEPKKSPDAKCPFGGTKYPGSGNLVPNTYSGRMYDASERSWRNARSVWHFPTEANHEDHYATFPIQLPYRCIKAGTSEKGCCPKCGKPWVRILKKRGTVRDGCCKLKDSQETYAGKYAGQDRATVASASILAREKTLRKAGADHDNPFPTKVHAGWRPGCKCDGVDRRIIESPMGERAGDDPSLTTGRAGMNRQRGGDEGYRPITRYEQAQYAAQLRESPHKDRLRREAGPPFDHYIRTDESGARPIPAELLDDWIGRGLITRVVLPGNDGAFTPVPCTVLDPFVGSGTMCLAAAGLGRHSVGIDLSEKYIKASARRVQREMTLTAVVEIQ